MNPIAYLEVYETTFGKVVKRKDRWRWRLVVANGHKVAGSLEGYANRQHAIDMGKKICRGEYEIRVR